MYIVGTTHHYIKLHQFIQKNRCGGISFFHSPTSAASLWMRRPQHQKAEVHRNCEKHSRDWALCRKANSNLPLAREWLLRKHAQARFMCWKWREIGVPRDPRIIGNASFLEEASGFQGPQFWDSREWNVTSAISFVGCRSEGKQELHACYYNFTQPWDQMAPGLKLRKEARRTCSNEGCAIVVPVPERLGHMFKIFTMSGWGRQFALAAQCKSLRMRFSRFATNATVGLEKQWCDHSVATSSVGCLSTYPLLQQVSPRAPRHLLPVCTAQRAIVFLYHKSLVMCIYIYIRIIVFVYTYICIS